MADATRNVVIKLKINEKHLEILRNMQEILESDQTIEVLLKRVKKLTDRNEQFIQPMLDEGLLIMGMSELGPYVVPSPIGGYIAVKTKGQNPVPDFSV